MDIKNLLRNYKRIITTNMNDIGPVEDTFNTWFI